MRTIIIDDELLARENLKQLLAGVSNEVKIVAEANGVAEAVKLIKKHLPEVVFCDIEMQVLSGLQLLDFFNEEEINFELIFVTSHSQFAIQAFRLSAIDYLLKPVEPQYLKEALNKVKQKKNSAQSERASVLKQNVSASAFEKMALPQQEGFVFVELRNIIWLKADNVYTEVALKDGRKILVSRTLKEFEKALPEESFFRSHRSYILNLNEITSYNKTEGGYMLMSDHTQIPLSLDKRENFTSLWKNWKL